MKRQKKTRLLLICLLSTPLMFAVKQDQSSKAIRDTSSLSEEEQRNEIAEVHDKVVKIFSDFEHKYTHKPRLICTTCKKETYTPRETLSWVFVYSYFSSKNLARANAAKKLLDEALEIFPDQELDLLVEFLARAANELHLECYNRRCPGIHWVIIKYE